MPGRKKSYTQTEIARNWGKLLSVLCVQYLLVFSRLYCLQFFGDQI